MSLAGLSATDARVATWAVELLRAKTAAPTEQAGESSAARRLQLWGSSCVSGCRQQWECWKHKWSRPPAALSKQVPIIRATGKEKMERFGQTAGVGRMGLLCYTACAARLRCLRPLALSVQLQ